MNSNEIFFAHHFRRQQTDITNTHIVTEDGWRISIAHSFFHSDVLNFFSHTIFFLDAYLFQREFQNFPFFSDATHSEFFMLLNFSFPCSSFHELWMKFILKYFHSLRNFFEYLMPTCSVRKSRRGWKESIEVDFESKVIFFVSNEKFIPWSDKAVQFSSTHFSQFSKELSWSGDEENTKNG